MGLLLDGLYENVVVEHFNSNNTYSKTTLEADNAIEKSSSSLLVKRSFGWLMH